LHLLLLILDFKNFKKNKIDIIKNNRPYNLLSGQIARDLKVGERKISKEIILTIFLLILLNFTSKHLLKKKIISNKKCKLMSLIITSLMLNFSNTDKTTVNTGECLCGSLSKFKNVLRKSSENFCEIIF
jgi:hypothetical protein